MLVQGYGILSCYGCDIVVHIVLSVLSMQGQIPSFYIWMFGIDRNEHSHILVAVSYC